MLSEEFLKPLGIPQTEAAKQLGISYVRLNEIINRRRGVSPDTALRLARRFGMTLEFWLGLQNDWDTRRSRVRRRRRSTHPELAG